MKFLLLVVSSLSSIAAFADDAAPAAAATPGQAPGTGAMLVPFLVMFGIMYFLMIRPQQKRMKEQQSMLGGLKEGDEVLTASGILGTVKTITDKMVTLEIDRNVNLKVLKSQVAHVLKGGLPDKLV
jgi:preprotein translocase subunit YajC